MQLVWQLKNLIRLDGQTQAWSNLSIKRFKERFIDLKICRLHHRKWRHHNLCWRHALYFTFTGCPDIFLINNLFLFYTPKVDNNSKYAKHGCQTHKLKRKSGQLKSCVSKHIYFHNTNSSGKNGNGIGQAHTINYNLNYSQSKRIKP